LDAMYAGDTGSVYDTLELAKHYKADAILLSKRSPQAHRFCHVPLRFLAIHAIELYLNAFLLAKGHDPKAIRGLQHDIGKRAQLAIEAGLILRKRTEAHLATLSANREYLVARYGSPDKTATLSQVNRVLATLNELSQKIMSCSDGTAPSPKTNVKAEDYR
jgi:hypothetical protein